MQLPGRINFSWHRKAMISLQGTRTVIMFHLWERQVMFSLDSFHSGVDAFT